MRHWKPGVLRLLLALVLALAAPSLPASAQPAAPEALILGPSDQIEVNIDNYPDLKTTTRLGDDGNAVLPLIGATRLAGMAPSAAARTIERAYANGGYIKAPTVRVEIIDYQSRRVSVLGEVNRQGLVALDRSYSLAELLAKVGGMTPAAGDTAIIVRARPDGSSERLNVDVGQLAENIGVSALTPIRAGDIVMVPKAPTFSVIGAVARAGTYPLKARMTVDQALAAAGDLSTFGSRSKLKIRRARPDGGPANVIKATPETIVEPGDIIVVAERLL